MLAVENKEGVVAVDCGGDLVQRLLHVAIDPNRIEAMIITHGHPDHVSGFPLLMQKLWLHGRKKALPVIGPNSALEIARSLWEVFGLEREPGMPEIKWVDLGAPEAQGIVPLNSWECQYGPVSHGPVTIGLRFRDMRTGQTVAYSSDTAPDSRTAVLARNADVLVHEANGSAAGHSSVLDAAKIAREAHVRRLFLVHLPPRHTISDRLLREAESCFPRLEFAQEGSSHPIGEYDDR